MENTFQTDEMPVCERIAASLTKDAEVIEGLKERLEGEAGRYHDH